MNSAVRAGSLVVVAALFGATLRLASAGAAEFVTVFAADVDLRTGQAVVEVPIAAGTPVDGELQFPIRVTHGVSRDSVFAAEYLLPFSLAAGEHKLSRVSADPVTRSVGGTWVMASDAAGPGAEALTVTIEPMADPASGFELVSAIRPIVQTRHAFSTIITSSEPGKRFDLTILPASSDGGMAVARLSAVAGLPRVLIPTNQGTGAVYQSSDDPLETVGEFRYAVPELEQGEHLVDMVDLPDRMLFLTQTRFDLRVHDSAGVMHVAIPVEGDHLLSPARLSDDGARVAVVRWNGSGQELVVWDAEDRRVSRTLLAPDGWRIRTDLEVISTSPYLYLVGAGFQFDADTHVRLVMETESQAR